jgi:hypothetical protein
MAMTRGHVDDLDRRIGRGLHFIRTVKGLTQQELAEALGVTCQQLQKYERATNRISASRLYRRVPVSLFFAEWWWTAERAPHTTAD